MKTRCRTVTGVLGFALLQGTAVWAQGPAEPVPPAAPNTFVALLLYGTVIFSVGMVVVAMRRAGRMQPKVDRSLQLAEENVRLAREQVALQTETNRLLTRLIETLGRT